ncbi:MAG: hypothetical protein VZR95_03990 [Alphaproteobacteria bacterium]
MSWLEKASEMLSESVKKPPANVDSSTITDPEKAGEIAEKSLNESTTSTETDSETNTDNGEEKNENVIQNKKESE